MTKRAETFKAENEQEYEELREEEEEQEEQNEEDVEDEEALARARGDYIEEKEEEPESEAEPETEPEAEPEGESEVESEEEEPEGEPEGEPEPEPKKEPAEKEFMLPKSRYDHAMARAREAEKRLAELESKQTGKPAAPEEPQVDPLETKLGEVDLKLAEAIAEGRTDDIVQLTAESRKLERELWQKEVDRRGETSRQLTKAELEYETTLAKVEGEHPELNPDNEAFDEGLVSEVAELKEAFQAKGHRPAEALTRALNYVLPQGTAVEPEAEPEPEAKPAGRKTDVKRNLQARKSQPPRMRGGVDSDKAGLSGKVDPMKLTDEDFEKLTEAQLAKMRGDEF